MDSEQMMNQRHDINEWHKGFRELLEGKNVDVRRDVGFQPGDLLVYHEYIDGQCTGREALFNVSWVLRGSDHNGSYEALIPAYAVVLGLSPANVLINQISELPRAITAVYEHPMDDD